MAYDPTINAEGWIIEEHESSVLKRIQETSVIERIATKYSMATDAKQIPRSNGISISGVVDKGASYNLEELDVDNVTLVAKKLGAAAAINHEDLLDPHVSVLDQIRDGWARSYAVGLDNACLGVTGDADHQLRPFRSVYYSLRHGNSRTNYEADENYVNGTSGVTYDNLSDALGKMEVSAFFEPSKVKVIAHPAFKKFLRGIKDNNETPIFVQGQGGDSGTPSMLFDVPVEFATGAVATPTMSDEPKGNPLLFLVNTDFLALGVRSGPESKIVGEDQGPGFLSDTALVKMRARRAFALTQEHAAVVLEGPSS